MKVNIVITDRLLLVNYKEKEEVLSYKPLHTLLKNQQSSDS